MGRRICPAKSTFPAAPQPPKGCLFPRALSKALHKHPASALCISTAIDPALFFQKCVHYWPEKEGTYGPFTVCVQGVSECVEYVVRDLSIQVG